MAAIGIVSFQRLSADFQNGFGDISAPHSKPRGRALPLALGLPKPTTARFNGDMNGSLTLAEFPGDLVRLVCDKCGRAGQYRKASLIHRFGADERLPDLREEIAQCERRGHMHDPCGVHYVGLTGTA